MAMNWTEEQQKVIRLRDRNILVSAAAGSGKTAVLVQRILTMLLDPVHPIDIDKLLIMTFTRAAALEMKTRLTKVLEEALSKDPENQHLQRQTSLIHNAQINTIDGFCAYVIRNYFHFIDLDPGYRTADEGELKLLKTDTMKELLEDKHAEGRKEFIQLLEAYAPGKTDEAIEKMILKLYEASRSEPWPEEWLDESIAFYQADTVGDIMDSEWMQILWKDVEKRLDNLLELAEKNLLLTREPYGPFTDEETALSDQEWIQHLKKLTELRLYDEMIGEFESHKWKALSRKKAEEIDEAKKQQYRNNRDMIKKVIADMQANTFFMKAEDVLRMLKSCRGPMEELVSLTKEYSERFARKKRQKNVLDFSDMEHFALDILVKKKENGEWHTTEAAQELSEKFEEILVDEYQDSNMVQETLMNLVSGWSRQKKNLFMVGDVKQSIYRFRQAKPELFMEKLLSYSLEDGKEQRVDLSKNFRSRAEVLHAVNYLFRKLMAEDLGRVIYDEKAALYPGASHPEPEHKEFPTTELILLEKDGPELEEEESVQSEREMEALAIAGKIKKLIKEESVYDTSLQAFRPISYKDIVILLRTASGWTEEFMKILNGQGIPVYTASKTGYFSAVEVVTLLNYLKVCDNFQQEIPLAGVLHSPLAGCTEEELAKLKIRYPKLPLYKQVTAYMEEETEDVLSGKLRNFMRDLEVVREKAFYTPIHQLILFILKQSGYQDYVNALPAGDQRKANLDMLVEKAQEYEKTSYRGLFNFVRYIENLQKYEVDFGEVNLDAAAQSVQIMTIHKSKGLEFPIVFVAGLGKQFNMTDLNASFLIDSELGVGVDFVNLKHRTKSNTLLKMAIRQKLREDSLGEELRVLYVALTRAKEKLILTGTIKELDKKLQELYRITAQTEEILPYQERISARTFWDWILPALARHQCMDDLYEKIGRSGEKGNPYYGEKGEFIIRPFCVEELLMQQVQEQTENQMRREKLEKWTCSSEENKEIQEEMDRRFTYQYPYRYLEYLPVKVSVSEIKRQKQEMKEEEVTMRVLADSEETETEILPRFMMEKDAKELKEGGATRGTAYHRALECLDYDKTDTVEQIQKQIEEWLLKEKIDETAYRYLRANIIWDFTQSAIGKRMKEAFQKGLLKREQPFVMNFPAHEVSEEWPETETILVQGIMDAWFLEGEEIVLVDYKTDRIREGQESILKERYDKQLTYYASVLERITGRKVKEKIIYSLTLQKAV